MSQWKKIWIRINIVSLISILIFIYSEEISIALGMPLLDPFLESLVVLVNIMITFGGFGASLSGKECIKLFIKDKERSRSQTHEK